MKKNNLLKLSQEWFTKGDHDINSAQIIFNEKGFTDTICFLCQQATEKYLKGYLVFNNINPKKTHELSELVQRCGKIDKNILDYLEEINILNHYYIEARYPMDAPIFYSYEEAKQTIKITESIIKFIADKIIKI
ncbi:HEPN domain-containing protein [Patescibacteria group bacterium]|nr:HEPN domain-containing protein [Patescibacteria group bacterium]